MRKRNLLIVDEAIVHINGSIHASHDVAVINGPGWHQDRFNTPASMAPEGKYRYCGYHAIVLFDGTIQEGRLLEYYGQHCSGHNYKTLGICFQGDPKKPVNEVQLKALQKWLIEKRETKLPNLKRIKQHSDYEPKKKPFCAGLSKQQMQFLNQPFNDINVKP